MSRFYEPEKERILQAFRNIAQRLSPDEICKFHKVCRGYRKDAFTCQHESEAQFYCGMYDSHKAAIVMGKMKAMLKETDFADFDI